MMELALQMTDCDKCKKQYLVGLNGHDIRKSKTSGGSVDGIPFMAIGNDEIEDKPTIPDEVSCKNCGKLCKVQILKESRSKS